MNNQNLWYKILLSAIFFNLSFFFLDYCGWMIIISFLLIFVSQFQLFKKNKTRAFLIGFYWGILVFSPHFIWLFELLLNKSFAPIWQSVDIYLFAIFYFSLTSALWFLFSRLLKKTWGIFLSAYIYFLFIEKYSLLLLGRVEGYPFLNPLIPLAKYKWFLVFYTFLFNGNFNLPNLDLKGCKVVYLKPVVKSFNQRPEDLSPIMVGQKIYHELSSLNLEKYSSYENVIVVSPETAYPFPLNKNLDQIKLWNCAMPKNCHFLLGSQRETGAKLFQTAYWLHGCRISDFYDKKHCVPFVEKTHSFWKRIPWANNIFLKKTSPFQKGKIKGEVFEISKDLNIQPQICSEFFCDNNLHKSKSDNTIVFLFVNDSWFLNYFKSILGQIYYLKSAKYQFNLVCIDHSGMILF